MMVIFPMFSRTLCLSLGFSCRKITGSSETLTSGTPLWPSVCIPRPSPLPWVIWSELPESCTLWRGTTCSVSESLSPTNCCVLLYYNLSDLDTPPNEPHLHTSHACNQPSVNMQSGSVETHSAYSLFTGRPVVVAYLSMEEQNALRFHQKVCFWR